MEQPAITQLATHRGDLFAFEVAGRIREADIEGMARMLTAAFERLDVVDVLIVMRRWEGIDLGAVFDREGLAAQARANSHVRRYGVVGAPAWAEAMIRLFAPLTPVTEKTFDRAEEEEAWAWIEGDASFSEARERAAERP